ncbi:transcriptional repressor [Nodularia chucula]|uniref:transcriptional repressor n=1 Tax=Nodularia chucula TaxID=3093667 RepID=UPI0039C6739F
MGIIFSINYVYCSIPIKIHKHYEINTASLHHHHQMVCAQCNMTVEFENNSILKQVEKSGLELIDC